MRLSVLLAVAGLSFLPALASAGPPALTAVSAPSTVGPRAIVLPPAAPPVAGLLGKDMFGRRSQLGSAVVTVRRAERGEAQPTNWATRNPVANRVNAFANGLRANAARATIKTYVRGVEERSAAANGGRPQGVTQIRPIATSGDAAHDAQVHADALQMDPGRYGLFVVEKAVTLERFHRTPQEITERFIDARGSVDGEPIPARRIFVQSWAPSGAATPTGKVFVVSPGYRESGRNFYAEVDALSRAGNDVIVMDHQWTGFSDGKPGHVDRGFGVARDVAAVAAYASEYASAKYPSDPRREVILVGHSMGAGAGVYGAIAMNDAGKILLEDGARMPQGLSAILLAPYLHATPSPTNERTATLGRVPGLRNAPLIETRVAYLQGDPKAQALRSDLSTLDDARLQFSALEATYEDVAKISANADAIRGRFYVIQSKNDSLASNKPVDELVLRLGARAKLDALSVSGHALTGSPGNPERVLAAAEWLTSGSR